VGRKRSQLGIDEEQSIWAKLGLTFTVVTLGPLIGLLFLIPVMSLVDPVGKAAANYIIEAFVVFLALLLVFIWWRPPWLRRAYLAAEGKVLLLLRAFAVVALLGSLGMILIVWLMGLVR